MPRLLHLAGLTLWYGFAVIVVLLATLFGLARLLLPQVDSYNAEVAARLSELVGQPLEIGRLEPAWQGFTPYLVLHNVRLLTPDSTATALQFNRLQIGFDLVDSYRRGRPELSHLILSNVEIGVILQADGRLRVAGLAQNAAAERAAAPLQAIDWLLGQDTLSLENSTVLWEDQRGAGHRLTLTHVNLTLQNRGDRHRLHLDVSLPRRLHETLRVEMEIDGNPLASSDWSGRLYAEGIDFNISKLAGPITLDEIRLTGGETQFTVWGEWSQGQLARLWGELEARDLQAERVIAERAPRPSLTHFAARFEWQRQPDGWQLNADRLNLVQAGGAWPANRLQLAYRNEGGDSATWAGALDYLRFGDLREWALVAGAPDWLEELQAQGELRDLHFHWRGGAQPDYGLQAEFNGVAADPASAFYPVAANGLNGRIRFDSIRGEVHLDSRDVRITLPKLFREPLAFAQLRGRLHWDNTADGWHIAGRDLAAANDDLHARAIFDLVLPPDGASPTLTLLGDFRDANGSRTPQYLPAHIMPPGTVKWLDRSIVAGDVPAGGVVFHGALRDFPFDAREGKFEVRFNVENGELDYAPGWAPVREVAVEVVFTGRRMDIQVSQGRLLENRLASVQVSMADMHSKPRVLNIRGQIDGPSRHKLDYLLASPLRERLGRRFTELQVGGDSRLDLALDIAFEGHAVAASVNADVELRDNTLALEADGQLLDQLNGHLHIGENGISAEQLQGRLYEQPAQFTVATESEGNATLTVVSAAGELQAATWAERFMPQAAPLLQGQSQWQITLRLPAFVDGPAPPVRLSARSDLQGTGINLPAPLHKRSDEAMPFSAKLEFGTEQPRLLEFELGNIISGVVQSGAANEPIQIKRAALLFGPGAMALPTTPGLRLTGSTPFLSVDEWRDVLARFDVPAPGAIVQGSDKPGPLSWLASADVRIRNLELYGQQLRQAAVHFNRDESALQMTLDSEQVAGTLRLPADLQRDPLEFDFSRLHLARLDMGTDADAGSRLDPRDLPAVRVQAADFRYGEGQFGPLTLEVSRLPNGVRLDRVAVKPRAAEVTAQGSWTTDGLQQQSEFSFNLESSNFGRTLDALGYNNAMKDGMGSAGLRARWPGSLLDPDVAAMQGEVSIDVREGQLPTLDPGGARLLGLLNLQALPRRLSLDFSDFVDQGFAFNKIKGRFRLADGNAYADKFYMEGAAARIDIAGRTGLVDQDFEQTVTVTPSIGDSLPLLGVLSGVPQIGATLLVLQKLFEKEIDKVGRVEYSVTGGWDEPQIARIKKPPAGTAAPALNQTP